MPHWRSCLQAAPSPICEEPGATLSDLPPAAGLEDLRELWQACLPLKVEAPGCVGRRQLGSAAGPWLSGCIG